MGMIRGGVLGAGFPKKDKDCGGSIIELTGRREHVKGELLLGNEILNRNRATAKGTVCENG